MAVAHEQKIQYISGKEPFLHTSESSWGTGRSVLTSNCLIKNAMIILRELVGNDFLAVVFRSSASTESTDHGGFAAAFD